LNYTQILSSLYVGSYPETLSDIKSLKDGHGITAVLNLQTDEDLRVRGQDWSVLEAYYADLDIKAQRVPMRDFDYDDQRRVLPKAVRVLAKLLTSGFTVYLHCNAGLGRSPLVTMAYLYWCWDSSLEKSIKHIQERRSCSPMTELLEVARQDLLQVQELRKRVALRAFELSRQRENETSDPFLDWVDAECAVLKEAFCRDQGNADMNQHVVVV
jgi:atypical dual specificity phosphatase